MKNLYWTESNYADLLKQEKVLSRHDMRISHPGITRVWRGRTRTFLGGYVPLYLIFELGDEDRTDLRYISGDFCFWVSTKNGRERDFKALMNDFDRTLKLIGVDKYVFFKSLEEGWKKDSNEIRGIEKLVEVLDRTRVKKEAPRNQK